MCGITGFLKISSQPTSAQADWPVVLQEMTQKLVHRGPDEDGFFTQGPVYLGMRRLKIIDLSTGKQPVSNEDGTVSVVYNGEIYNYVELREELIKKGHTFRTQTDTEVLVHLYEEEGDRFPRRLRGMFTFALWDTKKQSLLLGRDHFGIKPLYLSVCNGFVMFASEIKALKAHPALDLSLNTAALDDFLTLLFIPSPQTAYRHIVKCDPGTTLRITPDGKTHKTVFWDPIDRIRNNPLKIRDLRDIEQRLESKLSECVRQVLRSDVPLGVFLSAGMDSTLVTTFARQHQADLQTFTVYYEDEESYSERSGAALVARSLGTRHTEIPMDIPKDLPHYIWKVLSIFDQPFGDMSALPTYLLCQAARQHITVALSGEGGDELFGGYPTTLATRALHYYRHLPSFLRRKVFPGLVDRIPTNLERVSFDYKLKRFIHGSSHLNNVMAANFSWRGAFFWHERQRIYNDSFYQEVQNRSPFEGAMHALGPVGDLPLNNQIELADLKVYLQDLYLVKTDMNSMAHSLELRPTLLDPELAELAFQIPSSYKIKGTQTKWILRWLMRDKLPKEILTMPKCGFTPPLPVWLTEKRFQDFIRDSVDSAGFRRLGMINKEEVHRLLSDHKDRKRDNTRRLWGLLCLASFSSSLN